MKFLLYLGALTATLPSALGSDDTIRTALPACPPRPATPEEQEKIFYTFVNEFNVVKNIPEAFNNYVWVDYIQHNPTIGQGRDAAIAALSGRPQVNTTIVHQAFINNTGFVHHYEFASQPIKIIDAYRMNGSCIVEHWDVIANLTLGEIDPTPL
jgi:predicted SnoaL-like aldol condensation-catalyzing enzyme